MRACVRACEQTLDVQLAQMPKRLHPAQRARRAHEDPVSLVSESRLPFVSKGALTELSSLVSLARVNDLTGASTRGAKRHSAIPVVSLAIVE